MSNIIRVQKNKENPYFMMNKTGIEDKNLSWKAKGILSYLLSKPDNWKVTVVDLIKQSADGERAVRSGLKELKENRYLEKYPVKEKGKIIYWESVVYEVPNESINSNNTNTENVCVANEQIVDNSQLNKTEDVPQIQDPHVQKPHVQNAHVQNEHRNNNYINNNYINNNYSVSLKNAKLESIAKLPDRLTDIFQNCNLDLYNNNLDLKRFLETVIKDLYTKPDMQYKLRMGLTHTEIRQRLEALKLSHLDRALQNYCNAKVEKNPQIYFAKCLLTSIVEQGIAEFSLMVDVECAC